MKKITYQSLALRDLLKSRINSKRWTYKFLAQKVSVSVPTIKRWMTTDDIPFQKVLELLDVLELSIQDLNQALNFENSLVRPEPKKKEEDYLVAHPKEAFVLLLISLGFGLDEICKVIQSSRSSLERIFLSLDCNHLIEYAGNDKIRSLIRPPIKWSPKGPFAAQYFPAQFEAIVKNGQSLLFERLNSAAPDETVAEFGEVYMTDSLIKEFQRELKALIKRYKVMTRLERQQTSITSFKPLSYVIIANRFSSWKKVMWDK